MMMIMINSNGLSVQHYLENLVTWFYFTIHTSRYTCQLKESNIRNISLLSSIALQATNIDIQSLDTDAYRLHCSSGRSVIWKSD